MDEKMVELEKTAREWATKEATDTGWFFMMSMPDWRGKAQVIVTFARPQGGIPADWHGWAEDMIAEMKIATFSADRSQPVQWARVASGS
jgi:hypothetical protein